jgi:retron-type reverse transcriptase
MKSYHDLWPGVVSWNNLLWAYRACRRRKRFKRGACEFDFEWESNLLQLRDELEGGRYTPGAYRHFFVIEPKKRKISAAPFRDRVVHHAVVRVIEPLFERAFIHDSYACRRRKGTHRAIDRAQRFLRRRRFVLKTDIVKFFPNVDHQILLDQVGRRIKDVRLIELIRVIIQSGEGVLSDEAGAQYFPGDDLFAALRPKGLPIGNLTSQFFANVLLDPIDHFIKEVLRVPGYVRYADDLLLFGDEKAQLNEWRRRLADELARIRLRLHTNKTQLRPSTAGVNFLGFKVFRHERRLMKSGLRRFNRRLRRFKWLWKKGEVSAAQVGRSLRAWRAHVSRANFTGIERALWKRVRLVKSPKPDSRTCTAQP